MKKTLLTLCTLLFAATIFISCESTDTGNYSSSDEYDDGNSYEMREKIPGKSAISIFDPTEKYVFGDISTLFVYTPATPLKQHDAVSIYGIKNGLCGFGSKYLAAYYMVFWDERNHDLLEAAYNRYLSDFDSKILVRNSRKTIQQYGSIDVTLNWGTIRNSTPNYAECQSFIGYTFYNNSPYFVLTMYPAYNKYYDDSESAVRESMMLTYFFTKSQMEQLLKNTKKDVLYPLYQGELEPVSSIDEY